jgi:hypothetical protein
MKKIILYSFLFFYLLSSLYAIDIKLIRKFTLAQDEKNFLIRPGSFFVTEDSMIFVIDCRASNIKIFDSDGKLANVFGRKGLGPDEFIMPFFSNYRQPFLALADLGRRRYFIYKRIGKSGLEMIKCCMNTDMPEDITLLADGKLLIIGNKLDKNGKWQNLYIYDCDSNKSDFLLSHAMSYGYKSESEFKKFLYTKLNYIGTNQCIDWVGDTIYYTCTGELKIYKIDIKTRGLTSFGKKTENYVPPYVTPEIEKAHNEKQSQIILEARSKMTYVRDIFITNSKTLGLVYVGPLKKNTGLNVMLQFYTVAGEFIKEVEVLLNSKAGTSYELFFYFRKDSNLYYVLETETSEEFDQVFNVYEYRITE